MQLYLPTLVASLALVLALESIKPLRPVAPNAFWRWLNNLLLAALSMAVALLTPVLFWALAGLLSVQRGADVGLLHALDAPVWLAWVITFVVLDALSYAIHRLSHAVPWLWRLHAVHHSDTEMDATTTHRHHPLESAVATLITLPVLLLLGAPPMAVLASALVTLAVTTFAHANLSLGERPTRWLGWLLVTPDFHRNHHRSVQRWTDSNYGMVLPWFDRLLGTATAIEPGERQRDMSLGLEHFRAPNDQRLDRLLAIPFRRDGFGAPAGDAGAAAPADHRAV